MNKNKFLLTLLMIVFDSIFWANEFTMAHFLRVVENSNLDLKIENSRNDAVSARVSGIRLPPPNFSVIKRQFEYKSSNGFKVSQTPFLFQEKFQVKKNID